MSLLDEIASASVHENGSIGWVELEPHERDLLVAAVRALVDHHFDHGRLEDGGPECCSVCDVVRPLLEENNGV